MLDYTISTEQLAKLRAAHRRTRDQREADRIKTVVSLADDWPAEQVAEVLLIDSNTVRDHFRRYQRGGLPGLLHMVYQGSDYALTDTDLVTLDVPVQAHLYLTAKDVAAWVDEEFGVTYTTSGMTALLHRLCFVYKKPKCVPGKADPKAQEVLLADYEMFKQNKGENDVICFIDAVYPQHNPMLGHGWIKRGEDHQVKSNTGRWRVTLRGRQQGQERGNAQGRRLQGKGTINAMQTHCRPRQVNTRLLLERTASRYIALSGNARALALLQGLVHHNQNWPAGRQ